MKTLLTVEDLYFLVVTVKECHINETVVFKSDENKSILDYSPVYETKPANHWAVVDYISLGGLFKEHYESTILGLYDTRDNVIMDFERTALNESECFAMECARSYMKQYLQATYAIRALEKKLTNIEKAYNRITKETGQE